MSWEGGVFLLGAVRATRGGHEVVLAGAQPRLLLVYTALERGRVVPTEELAQVLWGDRPARHWEGALRGVVAKLRAFLQQVGPDAPSLDHVGPGYRFTCSDVSTVDVWRAELALAQAEDALARGDAAACVPAASEAAALLAAPLLVGVDEDWLAPWRTRFDDERRRARRVESAGHLALGRFDDAIASASAAVGEDAYDEDSQRALMVAFRAAGNRAEALRVYAECRRRLAEDLGVAPDAATEALYLELLAGERATPPLAATLADHPFVGQVDPLGQIATSWVVARRGRPQVVLLHGESGVGKTRLVLEAAKRADADHLLYGRSGAEQVVPFEPFVEALGSHVGELDAGLVDAGLVDLVAAVRAEIATLAETPTILALDDLHWADAGTLRLLRGLVGALDTGALLVVCTYRDDVEPSPELAATLAALRRCDGCREIAVEGLDPADVTELLPRQRRGRRRRARPAVVRSHRRQRLLPDPGAAGESGVPDLRPARRARHGARAGTPSPGEAVRRRPRGAGTRGGDRCLVPVSAAGPGRAGDAGLPSDAVGELVERHLLIEAGDTGIGFAHAIVRDAVYEQVSARRRRRLHRRVAEAIVDLWPDDPEWAASVARHLLAADDPSQADVLVDALLVAAAHASRRHAHDHAAELYQLASVHMTRRSPDDPRRAATSVALGAALRRAGDHDAAKVALEAALELARATGDARVGADAVLELVARGWRGAEIALDDADRAARLQDAVDRLGPGGRDGPDDPDDQRRKVTLLVEQVRALMLSDDAGRRRAVAEQAVALAEASHRADLQAAATEAHRLVLTRPDGAPARLALTDPLVGERAGELDAVQLARLRMWRLTDCLEHGDRQGLDRELWALTDVVARVRHPNWNWVVASWQALLTFLAGDADRADADARAAIEQASGPDHLARMLAYGTQMIGFRLQQGRGPEIVPLLRFSVASSPEMVAMRCVLALALAQDPDPAAAAEAAHLVGTLAADDFAAVPDDVSWTMCMVALAEASCELGDAATAARVLPTTRALSGSVRRGRRDGAGRHHVGAVLDAARFAARLPRRDRRGEARLRRSPLATHLLRVADADRPRVADPRSTVGTGADQGVRAAPRPTDRAITVKVELHHGPRARTLRERLALG